MQKIDRLGWADGIAFRSYGLRIGVRVTEAAAMDRVIDRLPPGWRRGSSPVVDFLYSIVVGGRQENSKIERFKVLYYDAGRFGRTKDFEFILKTFETHLQLLVADNARRRVFVHAGVVGWKNQAVLIPGMSFSGKTTLVSKLVQAGATYYSDEYAVLDENGLVHPYPRPLGVRRPNEFESSRVDVASLGGICGSRPLPVRLVIATKYRAGAKWRP